MSNTVVHLFGRRPLRRQLGRHGGFSLLELLIVIGIIALLAGVILGVLSKARDKARTISCFNNLRSISHAIMMYAQENDNSFPANAGVKPPTQDQDWVWWESTPPVPPVAGITMRISQINLHGIGKYLDGFGDFSTKGLQVLRCPSDARLQNKGFTDFAPDQSNPPMAYPTGYPFSYVINGLMCSGTPPDMSVIANPSYPGTGPNPAVRTMTAVKEAANKIMVYEEDARTIDDGFGLLIPSGGKTNLLSLRHEGFDDLDLNSKKDPITVGIVPGAAGAGPQLVIGNGGRTGNVAFCDGHASPIDRVAAHSKDHWAPDAAITALTQYP